MTTSASAINNPLTQPSTSAVLIDAGRAAEPRARARSHNVGFWLVAGAFLTAMAFSTVPTPLYPVYQHRDGFSTFLVTVVFAVYAAGVVVSVLLVGHVSDWAGRRRILIVALAIEVLSAAVFLAWPALPGLLIARVISGLGIGMIAATATAYLHELHGVSRPGSGRGRFEMVSTAANIGGLGFGPLVAGVLAQFVRFPLRTPYIVFGGLLMLSIIAVAVSPETVVARPEKTAWRPQRVTTIHGDHAGNVASACSAFTAFAIFGLFCSLAPGFVAVTLHHPSRLLAGVVVFMVFGAAALAQTVTTGMSVTTQSVVGLIGEAASLVVLTIGMETINLTTFLVGGALAGAGAGVLFKSAVGSVVAAATADSRGEALAGLFFVAYLGLIIPALGLGIATLNTSPTTAMLWFSAVLLALLAAGAFLTLAARRATLNHQHDQH